MQVGNLVKVVYGEYQGSHGRVSSIHLHKRYNETWYCVQLSDEEDKIFILAKHLKLIGKQDISR